MGASLAVIVNPAAGGGRSGRRWPVVAARLRAAGLEFDLAITERPGHATELARAALAQGAATIVAVGGDGTANEVLNGFFRAGAPINPAARLAVVPFGTGRDLARTLGLPGGGSVEHVLRGRELAVDVGVVRFRSFAGPLAERYFLNVADLGLGGETVERVNRSTKALGPLVTYLLAAVLTVLRARPRRARIAFDGGPAEERLVEIVAVANARCFGGGMRVAPQADLTDGRLDVVVLEATHKLDLLGNLIPRVYRGAHLTHPRVRHRQAERVCVESDERLLLEADGELLGTAPAEFSLLPRALRLLV